MNRWFLFLACLSLLLPSTSRADDQNASASLPFRLASGYLIEVEGRIGNQTHLKFILDTGASISIVGQRVAQKLKLDAQPAQSFNFDRNLHWERATLPDVQFGPIQATSVAVLVGDLSQYSEFAGSADAVIGMDLLRLNDFTLDYAAGRLLFDAGPAREYLAGGDPIAKCLILELEVQGHPVHLIVDTGSPNVMMYEERLRKSVPGLRTTGSIQGASMGRVRVKQAALPDVVLGTRKGEIPVVFLPAPAENVLPAIDGVAGVAALHAHRVHFDFSRKTLSWE
jgi:predicted aspartyl protease